MTTNQIEAIEQLADIVSKQRDNMELVIQMLDVLAARVDYIESCVWYRL